jgi:hypothetical protein
MSYIFESKRDLLYFKNYLSLQKAIEDAGGDGDKLIAKHEELLATLARNEISLIATYNGTRGKVEEHE